jgi:hypothetical protein
MRQDKNFKKKQRRKNLRWPRESYKKTFRRQFNSFAFLSFACSQSFVVRFQQSNFFFKEFLVNIAALTFMSEVFMRASRGVQLKSKPVDRSNDKWTGRNRRRRSRIWRRRMRRRRWHNRGSCQTIGTREEGRQRRFFGGSSIESGSW